MTTLLTTLTNADYLWNGIVTGVFAIIFLAVSVFLHKKATPAKKDSKGLPIHIMLWCIALFLVLFSIGSFTHTSPEDAIDWINEALFR